jgi:hypothetical protein
MAVVLGMTDPKGGTGKGGVKVNRLFGLTITVSLTLILGATAMAGPRTPYINRRQENQQDRIRQGIRSGELTRHEAVRLERQSGRNQAEKLIDKSDGYVTPAERRQLDRQLNRESRNIYRLKHNERERYPY